MNKAVNPRLGMQSSDSNQIDDNYEKEEQK